MGNVTFLGMQLADRVKVDVVYDLGSNLLELATKNHIPLNCDCLQSNCGPCAVKVVALRDETSMISLSTKERNQLLIAGKLSWKQFDAKTLPDHPPLWRLPCEYLLADEKIMVAF